MTRWFVIIGFLTLLWSSTALAQEPTGFAGFAWGTPRVVVNDELAKERCPWRTTYTTLHGHKRIVCSDYQFSVVGPVYLTLDFVGEVFTGYEVTVPRQLGSALRAAIPDILATPARAVPGMSHRTWKTSVIISESQCFPSSVCLTVTASQVPTPASSGTPGTENATDQGSTLRSRAKDAEPASPVTVTPSAQPGGRPGAPR
jgi:hypothetical protein